MDPDIFTPGTYLILVLLCFTIDVPLTVRHIFEDNHNWAGFRLAEKDNLRDVEIKEVNKMLSCKDETRGFFTYECESCGTQKTVYFGCNSRICTNCGKNHTDKWAKSLKNALFNESSPQTTANTQRLWSFGKPIIYKNTTRFRANTFGFYALNGNSVIDFRDHSKKEDVCEFLREIRRMSPIRRIIIILDNFSSHRARDTVQCAAECEIELVYLPSYSPDLNPLEYIGKSIRRVIS